MGEKSFSLVNESVDGWYWGVRCYIKENAIFSTTGRFITKNKEIVKKESLKYNHSEKGKQKHLNYKKSDKGIEVAKNKQTKYFNTPKGKASKARHYRKTNAKRRQLGFIPLNSPFEGSEGHHIDKQNVIYIPERIHQQNPHNIWTGEGMEEINSVAMMYEKDFRDESIT